MSRWLLVGTSLLLLLILIAGTFGVRFLRVAPLPTKGEVSSRQPKAKPDHALLPASETDTYVKYYLVNPGVAVQSWQPTEADLRGLEVNLPQISNLRESVSRPSRHIDNPNQYFRQYLAIVQSGRKQVFVNAFCVNGANDWTDWRYHLHVIVDGGDCYWQTWYDPITQKYSNLMINGVA